jgi:hypothetical protein
VAKRILTVRIQNKNLGKALQKLILRYGFKWNDGICKVRDCGENPFFLKIDFPNGTMEYFSEFRSEDVGEYIQFKDSYEVENDFDNPKEVLAFKAALQRYQKTFDTVGEPMEKEKPKVKYFTWVKKKGEGIQKFSNMLKSVDDI